MRNLQSSEQQTVYKSKLPSDLGLRQNYRLAQLFSCERRTVCQFPERNPCEGNESFLGSFRHFGDFLLPKLHAEQPLQSVTVAAELPQTLRPRESIPSETPDW
jgi:hypothetical protein